VPSPASDWAPYVIRRGDTLTALAAKAGVSRDVIWLNGANRELKTLRSNGDILAACDVIYLPPAAKPRWLSVNIGTTNRFVATIARMTVRVAVRAYRSASYSASARDFQTTGATDASGQLALVVPVYTREIRVHFDSSGDEIVLLVGHLDPVATTSGVRQRLTNLGFPTRRDDADEDDHGVRRMLALFQVAHGIAPSGELDSDTADALEREHGM
jgi:hypothetical protein